MGHLHLKAYPRSPFREEGGNPYGQEILVKCSDDEEGGRDLENLGESLGEADGLDGGSVFLRN